jgi:phosphatidyl-myo-inositol dimannoside synthase
VEPPVESRGGRIPVRILALVTDAYGASGGIACYNRDLLHALARCDGVERVVVLPRAGTTRGDDVPATIVVLRPRANEVAYTLAALGATLRRGPFDAIFCGHLYSVPLAAALARLTRSLLWVQLHGIEAWPRPGALVRRSAEHAGLVTAVSRHTRRLFLGWARVAPERVKVLPDTVDGRFQPGPKPADLLRRHGLEGSRVLLTVSRLSAAERYKGHDVVLRALGRLRANHPDLVYVIAGDGDDRPRLEQLASDLGVLPVTRFLGRVPDETLPALYRAADVFVMPSRGEGFGIAFLEAIASGLPVVAGATDGSSDPLRDGLDGRLVAPASDAGVAEAIADALSARSRAAAAAAPFARERFETMVGALVADMGARVHAR